MLDEVLEVLDKLETAGVVLFIDCSWNLYDGEPCIPHILDAHNRVLHDLEHGAGDLTNNLLLHHGRVEQN